MKRVVAINDNTLSVHHVWDDQEIKNESLVALKNEQLFDELKRFIDSQDQVLTAMRVTIDFLRDLEMMHGPDLAILLASRIELLLDRIMGRGEQ